MMNTVKNHQKNFKERDLTAMRNRTTLLRAEHGLAVPFLRPAGRLKLNTTFVMDNRRI